MIMVINKQEKRTYIFYERQVSFRLFCNNKNIVFGMEEIQRDEAKEGCAMMIQMLYEEK